MRTSSYTERRCLACRQPLPPDTESWKTLCRECFVEAKRREHDELVDELHELREEVTRLRSIRHPLPEPQVLRFAVQRCHPDANNGSRQAHLATQWLLSLRNSMTVGTA